MLGTQILIAEESPLMRAWLRTAVQRVADDIREVSTAVALVESLGTERCSLIICSKSFGKMGGEVLLSKVRDAGVAVPFLLLAPFCSDRTRSRVRRMAPAAVLDDPLDGNRLVELAHDLIQKPAHEHLSAQ